MHTTSAIKDISQNLIEMADKQKKEIGYIPCPACKNMFKGQRGLMSHMTKFCLARQNDIISVPENAEEGTINFSAVQKEANDLLKKMEKPNLRAFSYGMLLRQNTHRFVIHKRRCGKDETTLPPHAHFLCI